MTTKQTRSELTVQAAGPASPKRHEQESLRERARLLRESPADYVAIA